MLPSLQEKSVLHSPVNAYASIDNDDEILIGLSVFNHCYHRNDSKANIISHHLPFNVCMSHRSKLNASEKPRASNSYAFGVAMRVNPSRGWRFKRNNHLQHHQETLIDAIHKQSRLDSQKGAKNTRKQLQRENQLLCSSTGIHFFNGSIRIQTRLIIGQNARSLCNHQVNHRRIKISLDAGEK